MTTGKNENKPAPVHVLNVYEVSRSKALFLTSALDGGKENGFADRALYSQEKISRYLVNRRKEGRRMSLDALEKKKIFRRCQESNNGSSVLESVMQSSSR